MGRKSLRVDAYIAAVRKSNIQRVLDPIREGGAIRGREVRGSRRLGRNGLPHAAEGAAAVGVAQESGSTGGEGGLGGGGDGGDLAIVAVCVKVCGRKGVMSHAKTCVCLLHYDWRID